MDRSAQNIDRSSECEIRNLRRRKFVFDVSPLEIIYNEDEDYFIHGDAGAGALNKINLVIHAIDPCIICQRWSLKSDQQLNLSSSSCHDQHHHRDHHHHRDDDDDEEMIMITCEQLYPTKTADQNILLDRGVFASYEDDHAAAAADDYIMSQLNVVDAFYELEWIGTYEQLGEVKRCIIQRISEAKLAVLLAKPKTVRIRVDLSNIWKKYYANPAAAASAHAKDELYYRTTVGDELYYRTTVYDDVIIPSRPAAALRSSKEALETKIFEEEDLISSSSSSCSVCLKEFRVGVDVIKKMPCSHVFHSSCLMNWLWQNNTCPLCHHELPTFQSRYQFP